MTPIEFASKAEERANEASRLSAFNQFSLPAARQNLSHMLEAINRGPFFYEYTRHDISHIDAALRSLDWLIVPATAAVMTPADWLLNVLAIYFHDLGMLITRTEFEARRDNPEYEAFRSKALSDIDYQQQVASLETEHARDVFLYEEFVRATHASRVRTWIEGRLDDPSSPPEVVSELERLITGLPAEFREDLALVCESHHLDDLDDLNKYRVSKPYGPSDDETANVHFAALILRTADLLHITKDRTPAVTFALIAPRNPISQREWAKQSGVTSVRAQLGTDADGNASETASRHTIEVHAALADADTFFGLSTFLHYCRGQIQRSHELGALAQARGAAKHHFPWRYIDDSNVSARGYTREIFAFELDQQKILTLLTGHVLYDNAAVVLRELAQNSIDAVRLQALISAPAEPDRSPEVLIEYNSDARTLTVTDSGTGMSLDIIERNFLTVGSSRYQDDDFVRDFPGFHSISRFGIGALSTFMVADEVEVASVSEDDPAAHRISLRSVHGRYLMQVLDKQEPSVADLRPHGTRVRLHLRPSAELPDILSTVQDWIGIPKCHVAVKIDDREPVDVGFESAATLLAATIPSAVIEEPGLPDPVDREVRVFGVARGALEIAIAARWSGLFSQWNIVPWGGFRVGYGSRRRGEVEGGGTFIEGIRVSSGVLGLRNWGAAHVAVNGVVVSAPPPTVARDRFEDSPQLEQARVDVHSALAEFALQEVKRAHEAGTRSLTGAAADLDFILPSLGLGSSEASYAIRGVGDAEVVLIEENHTRRLASADELLSFGSFWTVESPAVDAGEALLLNFSTTGSLGEVVEMLGGRHQLPEPLVAPTSVAARLWPAISNSHEPVEFIADESERRVDVRWAPVEGRWREVAPWQKRSYDDEVQKRVYVQTGELITHGLRDADTIILPQFGTFVLAGSPAHALLADAPEARAGEDEDEWLRVQFEVLLLASSGLAEMPREHGDFLQITEERVTRYGRRIETISDEMMDGFRGGLGSMRLRVYDHGRYERRDTP